MKNYKVLFLLLGLSVIFTGSIRAYPISDHYDGKHFYNLYNRSEFENRFIDVWKWRLFEKKGNWPTSIINTHIPQLPSKINNDEMYVTFINHSSELIQLKNLTILTDPIFSERASPLSWYGPKRIRPPGIAFSDLPKIDIVIISHNHYDHLDLPSLEALAKKFDPLFIVPLNNAHILHKKAITKIIELDWWEQYKVNDQQNITLVPAQHWSRRTLFDRNESLWGSYVIQSDKLKIYFGGDTGYSPHVKLIKERMGTTTVAFIPIGAYKPRWFMKPVHVDPEEAVLMHFDLGATLSVATQFDTFRMASESFEDPVNDLKAAKIKHQLATKSFLAPEPGQMIYFKTKR